MPERDGPHAPGRRWVLFVLLGAFLTLRGYHALDGDQAYRLPVYLHGLDPSLYRDDPFVRSFEAFNPHRGSFLLIGLAAWPFGLSAGLGLLFVLTFLAAAAGTDRLARVVWSDAGGWVGLLAFGLVLSAQAGNVGTNHLFEPTFLDRQLAFALGWLAIAAAVASPSDPWRPAWPLGLAALVHPTVGLQLAALLGAGRLSWLLLLPDPPASTRATVMALAVSGLCLLPGLSINLVHSGALLDGVPVETFRRLALEVQGPQHMLPHLWRRPQWVAWFCYPALAALAVVTSRRLDPVRPSGARSRLLALIAVGLIGLGLAWFGIERLGHLRLTLFQPFRMATIMRGLCLVVLADHLSRLWRQGGAVDRTRVVLVVVGLTGDRMLAAVTPFECLQSAADGLAEGGRGRAVVRAAAWVGLGLAIGYLARHDTESGHVPLLVAAVLGLTLFEWLRGRWPGWSAGRRIRLAAMAWAVPALALVVAVAPGIAPAGPREAIARRCRFGEVPVDDLERLALWCREHTPPSARFVGPPGPKTFRLWSRRWLAFNRAASPYTAAGLADWADRFQRHVGHEGTLEGFIQAYHDRRHDLEKGYDRLGGDALAALAEGQGADHLVVRQRGPRLGPLELVHAEGQWGVYRRARLAARGPMGLAQTAQAGTRP